MNAHGRRGFGNGRFARSMGHSGYKHRRNADPVLPAPSSAPVLLSPSDPPPFHLNIREVLQSKLEEKVADMGNNPLQVDQLFPSICESCDEVSWQEPMEDPIDKEALKIKIEQCVQDAITRNNSSISSEQAIPLANDLSEVLSTIIPKTPRPSEKDAVHTNDFSKNRYSQYTQHRNWKLRGKGGVRLPPVLNSYSPCGEPTQLSTFQDCRGLPFANAMPSVFPENSICPVRCVLFENLPEKYYDMGKMKQQLESICSRIPGAAFLNFLCLPDEGFVIVSFVSNMAAASVIAAVNSSNVGSGVENNSNTVRVVPALENQQLQLWSSVSEKAKVLEQQWNKWYEQCKVQLPCEARREWMETRGKIQMINAELFQISSGESNGPLSEEQLKRKLYLLQNLVESNHTVSRVENQMKELYGEEYMQHLTKGATQVKYSSSNALASKLQNLIFIRELPEQLDDDAVLQFLSILGIRPVHIWRSPSSETSLCVEMENVGQVFAVLRQLDASEMRFGGALFSRER